MRSKKVLLTNFSRAIYRESLCLRPDNEKQLTDYITNNKKFEEQKDAAQTKADDLKPAEPSRPGPAPAA